MRRNDITFVNSTILNDKNYAITKRNIVSLILFILLAVFAITSEIRYVSAQTKIKNSGNLPVGISDWNREDSDKILNNSIIKKRLKKLLGKKNYAEFLELFETISPIVKKGNILFSSGCLIHACTHLESAIAIDLANNTIHAAIYNEQQKTKYFNEKGSKTPKPISNWANRLKRLKN